MTNVTPDSIFQVASGFMASKHLFVANEVGLFEGLAEGPKTLDELSARTGIPQRTIRILADAMVALGFVERQDDRYRNGPVAATFLSGRTPADLRPFLRWWNHMSYPAWMQLEASIRMGEAVVGHWSEELSRIFSEGVEALTAETAEALATTYDFGRHARVLDLGGGTGSFLLAVLRHHDGLKATLFESPTVAALARKRVVNTPLEESVQIVEGDFFTAVMMPSYSPMWSTCFRQRITSPCSNVFASTSPMRLACSLLTSGPIRRTPNRRLLLSWLAGSRS